MWEGTQRAALAFAEALAEEASQRAGDLAYALLVEHHFTQRSRFLVPEDAATYLGVSRKRIHDLTSSRRLLPDGHDGRTPLFTRATLDSYALEDVAR